MRRGDFPPAPLVHMYEIAALLREKLERDAAEPEYILTVRGVGYRFRDK